MIAPLSIESRPFTGLKSDECTVQIPLPMARTADTSRYNMRAAHQPSPGGDARNRKLVPNIASDEKHYGGGLLLFLDSACREAQEAARKSGPSRMLYRSSGLR